MRPTVKDVALRAGVSPKTVSNVINGQVFVRPETVEKVRLALTELDYVPNLSARSLRNGRSGVIALSLPDLGTPYSAEMLHAFVTATHDRGWSVQVDELANEPGRERSLVSRAREHLVDGLILNPVRFEDSAVRDDTDLPPIVIIGEIQQRVTDQVWVDSVSAASDMTHHLLATGRSRIAVVGSPGGVDTSTAGLRRDGYRPALADAGVPFDARYEIPTDWWSAGGGARAAERFFDEWAWPADELPDAYFCFTDSLAIGVMSVLAKRGIRIPADAAVVGFDDLEEASYAIPALTSITFDKALFARTTIDLLADRVADRAGEPRLVTIPHTVAVRASSAPGIRPA